MEYQKPGIGLRNVRVSAFLRRGEGAHAERDLGDPRLPALRQGEFAQGTAGRIESEDERKIEMTGASESVSPGPSK